MTEASEGPAWRRRAVERSIRAVRQRAEQRVQRFLDTAQEVIAEKGTTDFTVQEIVDRSEQSLRSFYQHFNGKHELLLALFEDALARSAANIRETALAKRDPLQRLKVAVEMLYESSRPDPNVQRPLFNDFALQLLVRHPTEVAAAHLPLLVLFTELIEDAAKEGAISADRPRRVAALMMQTTMFTAHANGSTFSDHSTPLTAEEVWRFCLGGISGQPGGPHPDREE
ncbi:TetR/AcrR family transcriptional regulator [Actinomadura vinacea]|uniref:TetR/AcrR family transcriptional regulator n=1 Tax=Actinomadura vinacea TaxID=115336 RepID=A0ABN3IDQ6_9ACTN